MTFHCFTVTGGNFIYKWVLWDRNWGGSLQTVYMLQPGFVSGALNKTLGVGKVGMYLRILLGVPGVSVAAPSIGKHPDRGSSPCRIRVGTFGRISPPR